MQWNEYSINGNFLVFVPPPIMQALSVMFLILLDLRIYEIL